MDVGRDVVIHALRCGGITVMVGDGEKVTFIKGQTDDGDDPKVETQILPAIVPRRLVVRLANKFGVNPEYFFHPDRIPDEHRHLSNYTSH